MKINNDEILQVMTFNESELGELKFKLNEYLNSEDEDVHEIIDIKYSSNVDGYSAMIIYKCKI